MRSPEAASLAARVRAWVAAAPLDPPDPRGFAELALAIHRFQRANDPAIAALGPEATEVADIPAVPVGLFKDLDIGTVPPDAPGAVVFRTSGTAEGRRGVHRLWSTDVYDLGAERWHRRCVPDAPTEVAALLVDPADAPDSSLSHMVAAFGPTTWHLSASGLDREGLERRVAGARGPLYIASTGFAMAEWLAGEVPALPPGSVVMVTGGFKGRVQHVDAAELVRRITARLRPERLVHEYGMTELSSQLWAVDGRPFQPPPWLRVVAVDPATGAALPAGVAGQLRFVDLCNVDSTLCIDTLDAGAVDADGGVHLHGRLVGAEVRGCSLTVEEILDGRRGPR